MYIHVCIYIHIHASICAHSDDCGLPLPHAPPSAKEERAQHDISSCELGRSGPFEQREEGRAVIGLGRWGLVMVLSHELGRMSHWRLGKGYFEGNYRAP